MRRGAIRWVGRTPVVILLLASVAFAGPPAMAACHNFAISASPQRPREGAAVTVIVSRDAAVAPSMIDVSTVDGTATSEADYEPLERTILFTNETSQTLEIATSDDDSAEPAETFQVHLSNPGGCDPNPNFVVASDVRVTIRDNDGGATTTPPPETTEPAPTESVSEAPTPGTPSPTEVAAPEESGGGLSGGAVAAIVGAIGLVIALVGIGLLRRRRTGS